PSGEQDVADAKQRGGAEEPAFHGGYAWAQPGAGVRPLAGRRVVQLGEIRGPSGHQHIAVGQHGPGGGELPVAGLYSSAVVALVPPAISTWPLFSRVALRPTRGVVMLPVGVNVPVAGLYSSALA